MKYKSKIIGNTTNGFPSINKGTVTKNEENKMIYLHLFEWYSADLNLKETNLILLTMAKLNKIDPTA